MDENELTSEYYQPRSWIFYTTVKILFIAAEMSPLVKVGGLADVIGALPKALNKLGHDVRVMLPYYGLFDLTRYNLSSVFCNINKITSQITELFILSLTGSNNEIKVYLIKNDEISSSQDVYDANELRRFLFFDKTVVEILSRLDWQPDIVHCHDWHTGLIPMWLKKTHWCGVSLFTIHNLAYQGSFDNTFLSDFGLAQDWRHKPESIRVSELPLNFMSQGIAWADMITTVSENYAREIVTPEYGAGLERLLYCRRDKLLGIINGIDYEEYNPSTDRLIAANYDCTSLERRSINKVTLQRRMGLVENNTIPLIGMVSRLDEQKGLDIVIKSFPALFERMDVQMIILGRGRQHYQSLLKEATDKYPQNLAVSNEYDEALAHLIYAGCDIFLMPSRFEPCGLGQLIAMRYGAIPLVRYTGGLVDTVADLSANLDKGSGFLFKEYDVQAMLRTIWRAINAYKQKKAWREIMRRIMSLNFSWQNSAQKYEEVYQKILELNDRVSKQG